MTHRFAVKFAGESGQGINTLGEILAKAIKNSGYHTFAYREYPSIIKGGYASYQMDFSSEELLASSKYSNFLASLAPEALSKYTTLIAPGGVIVHSIKDFEFSDEQLEYIRENKIEVVYIDTQKIAQESDAPLIMANVVILGYLWKLLGFDIKILEKQIRNHFKDKKNLDMEAEIRCLTGGYEFEYEIKGKEFTAKKRTDWSKSKMLTANQAIALGAISAGCRAYYAYPMTPSTDILNVLGSSYMQTGMVVKQAESEITAVQMVMGSMYMGTRAFTATSGGGFDLMSETLSCAGMTETPLVIVLGQRAGSGTGVPTWTGSSDLNVALNTGHGEFPRCVLASSDAIDSYELIQQAFNISEKYQIPVILLTEKQNAESLFNIKELPKPIKIVRSLKEGKNRYEITESGISPRWIPQKGKKTYLTNSDEHTADGISTEDPESIVQMAEKRMRKLLTLKKSIPQPKYYGAEDAKVVFVGMGTTKNAVLDAMKQTEKEIGCLHYEYIFPLQCEKILELSESKKRLVLIENNQTGELGELIKRECSYEFTEKLLKFDSRPFFVEDILDFLKK
ncbi:MAG: 2-oxoacid:acceptor oxidoreductase subunit alpha [Candidatus Dojkabacteria bacterium]|jgi:2-oxoglutarate ferredoxin oxidoreductase subunit alpha|nr:2-oxoacid:acceptor oxidoreductase subunit alpha [Candidatus Dojkabacteria bacterium]